MLRGDNVKDDTGCHAVFNAAKVLDTVIHPLGVDGEANDAVYTRVEIKDDPSLLKVPDTACSTKRKRLPHNRRPTNWDKIDDPKQCVRGNGKLEDLLLQEIVKTSKPGNAHTFIEQKWYSCQYTLSTSRWWFA